MHNEPAALLLFAADALLQSRADIEQAHKLRDRKRRQLLVAHPEQALGDLLLAEDSLNLKDGGRMIFGQTFGRNRSP
jgi:hypothetical protein